MEIQKHRNKIALTLLAIKGRMVQAILILGTNLGDTFENLERARIEVSRHIGEIMAFSGIYETGPWGFEHENNFLNQVLVVKTSLSAMDILSYILDIEKKMGRIRNGKGYQARIIDIDILYYNEEVVKNSFLVIPHPLLHKRRFVLEPLAEVLPDFTHPVLHQSNKQLLKVCKDHSRVVKVSGL